MPLYLATYRKGGKLQSKIIKAGTKTAALGLLGDAKVDDTCIVTYAGNPERCYMCCARFGDAIKPIPAIAGRYAPGWICQKCAAKIATWPKKEVQPWR